MNLSAPPVDPVPNDPDVSPYVVPEETVFLLFEYRKMGMVASSIGLPRQASVVGRCFNLGNGAWFAFRPKSRCHTAGRIAVVRASSPSARTGSAEPRCQLAALVLPVPLLSFGHQRPGPQGGGGW